MNKYNSIPHVYHGVTYASRGEAQYAEELNYRVIAGEITSVVNQFPMPISVNGILICRYIADFLVTLKDGSQEIHEYKGFATDVFKLKWKLVQALYNDKFKFVLIHHTR